MAVQSLNNVVNAVHALGLANITKKALKEVLQASFQAIEDITASGDKVRVRGFGTFSEKTRPARAGRNPATGAAVAIPEKTLIHFKASKHEAD